MIKTKSKLIKSPLKWAGGKSSIVPKLMEIWDDYRDMRYSQPPTLILGTEFSVGL